MRISHWSSDVCSSDLGDPAVHALAEESVSVARDPAIDGVAQRGGDQAEDAGDCPGQAEPLIEGEDGITVAAYPRPLDEERTEGRRDVQERCSTLRSRWALYTKKTM